MRQNATMTSFETSSPVLAGDIAPTRIGIAACLAGRKIPHGGARNVMPTAQEYTPRNRA
jgi:hypothetical protein